MKRYSLAFLQAQNTRESGHFGNLKISTPFLRVWLDRMTKADGAKYDNGVIVEIRNFETGDWETVAEYPATKRKSDGKIRVKLRMPRYHLDFSGGCGPSASRFMDGKLMDRIETFRTEKMARKVAGELNGAMYQLCRENGMDWLYNASLPE